MNLISLWKKRSNYTLLFICIGFLILTTYEIKREYLYTMEWYNIRLIFEWRKIIISHLEFAHLPLYDILLLSMSKFFTFLADYRYISVFFGLASLIMLYKFAKKVFNQEVGLLSALFFSVSPLFVHYSRQIETYTLFTFLSILNIFLFWSFWINGEKKYLFWFYISVFLLFACHCSAFIITFAEIIFLFILNKSEAYKRKYPDFSIGFLSFLLFLIVLSIAWFLVIYFNVLGKTSAPYFRYHVRNLTDYLPLSYLSEFSINFVRVFLGVPKRFTILILPFILSLFYFWFIMKRNNKEFSLLVIIFFGLFFVGEIIYIIFFAVHNSVYLNVRHFLCLQPFLFILTAYSLIYLMKLRINIFSYIICGFLFICFLVNIAYSGKIISGRQNPDYGQAIAYQKENLKDLDIVAFSITWYYQQYYYHLTGGKIYKDFFTRERPLPLNEKISVYNMIAIKEKDLDSNFNDYRKKGCKRLWFVDLREKLFDFPHSNDDYSEYVLSSLKKKYRIIAEKHFSFISLYLFALG